MKSLIIFSLLFLLSCQTAKIKVELVEQTSQCRQKSAGFEWVDPTQSDVLTSKNPFLIKSAKQNPKEYDFEGYRYLLVSAGAKPTRGYSYELTSSDVLIKSSVVKLPLRLSEPSSAYAQAQVISYPCALLRAKKEEVQKLGDSEVTFILDD